MSQSEGIVRCGGGELWQRGAEAARSQEAERDECWQAAHFLLFNSLWDSSPWILLLFRMGIPISGKLSANTPTDTPELCLLADSKHHQIITNTKHPSLRAVVRVILGASV